jgi:uncharacterized membrane protein YidH (DUF202 family)
MSGPPEPEEFDPGLARERTRLAWTRTAIAFAAVGAAIVKTRLVAGLVVLALAAVVWGLRHLFRETFLGPAPGAGAQPRRLLGITATVVAVAVVALVVAFLGHPR